MTIKYLSTSQVIELHDNIIRFTGGLPGLRDRGLLESALHAPQTTAFGQEVYYTGAEKGLSIFFTS